MAVSLIAAAYFQYQRMQPVDAFIATVYGGYIVAAGLLGYYFARWYAVTDAGWFEAVSVPVVISLLAPMGACVLPLALGMTTGRVSNLYDGFLGAMLLVVTFLEVAGPIALVAGLVASIVLRFRARDAACAT